jgi:hypothetical protein
MELGLLEESGGVEDAAGRDLRLSGFSVSRRDLRANRSAFVYKVLSCVQKETKLCYLQHVNGDNLTRSEASQVENASKSNFAQ